MRLPDDAAEPAAADDAALRPFVLTSGRVAPGDAALALDTLLRADPTGAPLAVDAAPQSRALLRLCRGGTLSVAEAAAHLALPVSVVLVLAADLVASHHLRPHGDRPEPTPGHALLQKVLDGLNSL
ncbi:DUF742 domain-containing protein [Actinomadura atramentaria]|uniref:DUF742 domain-containing protein n=1 Tax=Actinomadura atramentaria TaxID=1990 RepID=UPI00039B3555|nr:DUF742 domain-containing protein [Actinomadura atramentaria]